MAKIYLVQHQAHGVVGAFPFAEPPTEAQLERVWTYCFGIHGASHQKTPSEPYWQQVLEVELLGPEDMPAFEPPGPKAVASEASVGQFQVAGVGTVTPR